MKVDEYCVGILTAQYMSTVIARMLNREATGDIQLQDRITVAILYMESSGMYLRCYTIRQQG